MSRGFNTTEERYISNPNEMIARRTPQVLKIVYINDKPITSIIRSKLENTKIHVPGLTKQVIERKDMIDRDPSLDLIPDRTYNKYMKYKMKYQKLKQLLQ
jgi:hypothetical protein